jgi:predicted AlkP superfamily phosphohydrolase/phosphomutase
MPGRVTRGRRREKIGNAGGGGAGGFGCLGRLRPIISQLLEFVHFVLMKSQGCRLLRRIVCKHPWGSQFWLQPACSRPLTALRPSAGISPRLSFRGTRHRFPRPVHLPGWSAILLLTSCSHPSYPKLIVLGIDGMDPHFVQRHWDQLPNLRHLRNQGGFSTLATTTPPQSPVAWSTFSTGLDPIQHGLFDFVHRDPATLQPLSSFAETLPPAHQLTIGPYVLPLSTAQVRSFRKGHTFWEILAARGIPATVIRMPANYPPVPHAGEQLAGMGTPDLEGTFGTFTFYSDDPLDIAHDVPGGHIVPVSANNGHAILPIEGPPDTLRSDRAPAHLELVADIDSAAAAARFTVAGRQFILKQGEWSPWIRVQFPLIDHVAAVAGMFRLYARQLQGGIRIYRTPLNIDPSEPALPVSFPSGYARDLAERIGPFYTQGIEEDTAALRQGVLTLPEYLDQSRIVQGEHDALLRDALSRYHDGLLFFYFSEVDQNSHMLWGRHEAELLATYQAVDAAIGRVMSQAGDALIMVMSDHGFAAFDTAVNLNAWLRREGFLTATNGQIDWKMTKAYAMGLNALYINLAGREKYGMVHDGAQREALTAEIIRRLQAEKPAVENVVRLPQTGNRFAPDLIVGYAPGFRASWETALGAVPSDVLVPNDDAWIGDHCIAPEAVPGILVSNRKFTMPDPKLQDLTITILKRFGVRPDPEMKGRAIY